MKRASLLLLLLLIVLLALPALATNKTVKQAGGGDYTTITACINAMAPGDTCTVYAGDYSSEGIHTMTAGTAGLYKTVQINTGDTVTTKEWVLASYTKLIGFTIQDPSSPLNNPCVAVPGTSTQVWIQNNHISQCGTMGVQFVSNLPTYVYILNNTITNLCSTLASPNVCLAINTRGDHWLISGNDISHASDAITLLSSYTIYRDNHLHDFLDSECTASSLGGNGSNCHIDFAQTEPTADLKHIVIEGNYGGNNQGGFDGTNDHNGHGFLFQGDACPAPTPGTDPYPCSYAIIRENALFHIAGGALLDDNADKTNNSMGFTFVKSYNNTYVDMDYIGATSRVSNEHSHYSSNGAELNNIWYYPQTTTGTNPYYIDLVTASPASYGHNLAWCSTTNSGTTEASPCTIYGVSYTGPGLFAADTGNQVANPKFTAFTFGSTDYSANNFALAAGSPAIGAGTYLTTVTSGCGTADITVADASYFQDGFGLSGVNADGVRLGATNHYTISSIDYPNNILHLTTTATCSPGDGVYLFSDSSLNQVISGANPDLGAFPSGITPAPSCTLTSSATTLKLGQTVTLTLATSNSPTSASGDQGTGAWNTAGEARVITPSSLGSITTTITVSNSGGPSTCQATYRVDMRTVETALP